MGWTKPSLRPSLLRAGALAMVFAAAKALVWALRTVDGAPLPPTLWVVPALLGEDVWVALAWLLFDGAATYGGSRGPRLGTFVERALGGLWFVIVLYVAVNVPLARTFASPLTVAILAAAGGALRDSIVLFVSLVNLAAGGAILLVAFWAGRRLRRWSRAQWAILGGLAALVLLLEPAARRRADTLALHRNALAALVESALARRAPGAAPSIAEPPLELDEPWPSRDLRPLRGRARGRNVVWVTLESTAARYLAPWGARSDPMPRLSALARQGLLFEHAYSAYPESIKGLFAQLCATPPGAHTDADRYTAARIPCASIAEQLAGIGYGTALFHSGHFQYLGMEGVVRERGFATLVDALAVAGPHMSSFGVDEAATVARLLAWIDEQPRERPFFAMYLPIAGHHPYHAPGTAPRPFPEATELDAYRNDLAVADAALGTLIDGLAVRGLLERTLLVIAGDHGEAFQQHPGNFAHTLFIYEENVHVPLLFLAPGLGGPGERVPQVASLIDLAPTILDLLGRPAPRRWQGRSLLEPGPGTARFFVDQAVWQVGLRVGRYKLIHEPRSDRSRLFDLVADPLEQWDVSSSHPLIVGRLREHLLGFSARQRARILGYRTLWPEAP